MIPFPPPLIKYKNYKILKKVKKFIGTLPHLNFLDLSFAPLNSTFFQIYLFLPLIFLVSALQGFSK